MHSQTFRFPMVLPLLFSVTLFSSAFLLFCVQPIVGKMLLPLLGSSPAVWNTCLLFYLTCFFLGYLYAHVTSRWLSVPKQVALQFVVLCLSLFSLPIGVGRVDSPTFFSAQTRPITWLLLTLVMRTGFPFFALSASLSLFQSWFSRTRHPSAINSYFLYSVSNLGALIGLLGYPILIEPSIRLGDQSRWWAKGYWGLLALFIGCSVALLHSSRETSNEVDKACHEITKLNWHFRLRWLALAFVPASLMLGVTTYLSTNVAPLPMLWVIPFALYLISFILVFSRRFFSLSSFDWLLGFLTLPIVVSLFSIVVFLLWLVLLTHLLFFFSAAMVCHGQLSRERPEVEHLTEFYLWISLGSVLGGIFNTLIVPWVFHSLCEYSFLIVFTCALRPSFQKQENRTAKLKDFLLPVGLAALTVGLVQGSRKLGLPPGTLAVMVVLGLPAILCYSFVRRPFRFALGVAVVLITGATYELPHQEVLFHERNFFGFLKIIRDTRHHFVEMIHGGTPQGRQSTEIGLRNRPLGSYSPTGPVGEIFSELDTQERDRNVAVLGLGVGSLAGYATSCQKWVMYEIDPIVERVASDRRYFTFLRDSLAKKTTVVLGDARLKIAQAPDHSFAIIVIDALRSDSVFLHLITREALGLYLSKLEDDGLIVFNISNRYLNLRHTLAGLAASLDLTAYFAEDSAIEGPERLGKEPSRWVVMARHAVDLKRVVAHSHWQRLQGNASQAFTDDFSNVLSVIRW